MREADETPQQNGRDGLLMATIALIDDRTVSLDCDITVFLELILALGPPDPVRPGHRRSMLGRERAGREQLGCGRHKHWYLPFLPELNSLLICHRGAFQKSGS